MKRGHDHDAVAPAREELLGPFEPGRCDQHVLPEAMHHLAPAAHADPVTDVVTEHRRHERHRRHTEDVQASRPGVDRRGDHDRLTGRGHAEAFHADHSEDREVAPAVEDRGDAGEEAGQVVG